MKKTIRRRTEITIETREIRTIRGHVAVNVAPVNPVDDEVFQPNSPMPPAISRLNAAPDHSSKKTKLKQQRS